MNDAEKTQRLEELVEKAESFLDALITAAVLFLLGFVFSTLFYLVSGGLL
jgi:hypothetical protein